MVDEPGTQGNPTGTLTPEQQAAQAAQQAELQKRAEAEGKTVEQLVAEDAELKGIIEKYGNDPKALAKAYREMQQGVTKKIEEETSLRKAAEEQAKAVQAQLEKKPVGEDPIAFLEKQYPNVDREWLKVMFEIASQTAGFQVQQMQATTLEGRIAHEKTVLANDKMYQRYKDEVDAQLAKAPAQQKMQPGIVKNILQWVVGQHILAGDIPPELIEEAKKAKMPEKTGGVKGSKPGAPAIGAEGKSILSPRQEEQRAGFGITQENYLDILKRRKIEAKKNQMPEPELISDPVSPKR